MLRKEGKESLVFLVRFETSKTKVLELVAGGWTPGDEDQSE